MVPVSIGQLANQRAVFLIEIDVVEADAIEADAVETDVVADVDLALEQPEVQDQLELVPPSEESDLDSAHGFEETQDGSADASVSVSTLRQDLARSEEDLITQQQENEYLAERIKELETQLLTAEENKVEDANLANMEARLREERLAAEASARQDDDTPWYSRLSGWLIGLLVLVVAVVAWLMKRRRDGAEFDLGAEEDQLREIKDEAEEVLRVLEDSEDDATGDDDGESSGDATGETPVVQQFGGTGDEAEILDEESSDPEIQLDLARAYISMGDKEAARVILDEVESNGSEEQREEAKKMLELLAR
jgi:FimV-like protein